MLPKILDFLNGKRTVVVAFLVATISLLRVIWPEVIPDVDPKKVDLFVGFLGGLAVYFRLTAKTPGAFATKTPRA